jgi:hypothetical protein
MRMARRGIHNLAPDKQLGGLPTFRATPLLRFRPLVFLLRFPATTYQAVKHRVDQRIDIGVGKRPAFIGHEHAVIQGAIKHVEHNISTEITSKLSAFNSLADNLARDLPARLDPTLADRLPEVQVNLGTPDQGTQNLAKTAAICFRQEPHRCGEAFARSCSLLNRCEPCHLGKESVHHNSSDIGPAPVNGCFGDPGSRGDSFYCKAFESEFFAKLKRGAQYRVTGFREPWTTMNWLAFWIHSAVPFIVGHSLILTRIRRAGFRFVKRAFEPRHRIGFSVTGPKRYVAWLAPFAILSGDQRLVKVQK